MKLAIIGNMNNNHFSLMRYFRDFGIDAHLLLYKNDNQESNVHFKPEFDTCFIEKWLPFIHQTNIYNGTLGIIKNILFLKKIKKYLTGYTHIIANGFMPGLCYLLNRDLDIFIPYAIKGEFLYNFNPSIKSRLLFPILKKLQIKGLQSKCHYIFSFDQSEANLELFNKYNIKTIPMPIPIVYNLDYIKDTDELLNLSINKIKELSLNYKLLFSHASHYWKGEDIISKVKRNDLLIKAYANYLESSNCHTYRLVLTEYGRDVECSKALILQLGIKDYVTWIPKLPRKEIMQILDFVDLGASEFGGYLWGGVGWEFISKGVPFFHSLDFRTYTAYSKSNITLPFFFNVKDEHEIAKVLLECEDSPETLQVKRYSLKEWNSSYQGASLINRYISYLHPS